MTNKILNALLAEFGDTAFSTTAIAVSLCVASCIGLFIYLVYHISYREVFYSRSFHKLVALIPVVTTAIMLAMQSSLIVSIGSLGALSLVRFRNSVRDPMDMVFLLWSVGVGVICGARMYITAVLVCLIVTVLLFGLELLPTVGGAPLLLVIGGSAEADAEAIVKKAKEFGKSVVVKSRAITPDSLDMVIEIRTVAKNEAPLVKACADIAGVKTVSLVNHDGEIRG